MARIGHVRVDLVTRISTHIPPEGRGAYPTVGTVGAPPLLRRLVDLDVLDDQVAGIKPLRIRVGLCILEQREEELCALDGPAGTGDAELLSCSESVAVESLVGSHLTLRTTPSPSSVPPHGYGLLVALHVLEELHRALQLPPVDGLRRLARVLE